MGGASQNNLEHVINTSTQFGGFRADLLTFAPEDWFLDASDLVLTAGTTPAKVVTTDGFSVVSWAANCATTVKGTRQFRMPGEYAPKVPPIRPSSTVDTTKAKNDDLVFLATMRRTRNAADSAAFAARLTILWMAPGGNAADASSLTTNPTATLASITADNTATLEGYSELTFDIGARLRAEGKRINPGDVVRFTLHVDAQYATAGMEFMAGVLRGRRHAALTFDPPSPANFRTVRGG